MITDNALRAVVAICHGVGSHGPSGVLGPRYSPVLANSTATVNFPVKRFRIPGADRHLGHPEYPNHCLRALLSQAARAPALIRFVVIAAVQSVTR